MFTATYTVYVERQAPAGMIGEYREVQADIDTDDIDQAYELADRMLANGVVTLPAGACLNTLRINMHDRSSAECSNR